MKVDTFVYDGPTGWSNGGPATRDGPETLVLIFGAPAYFRDPGVIEALVKAYPGAKIAGCSSAGEIEGRRIRDGTLSIAVARFDRTRLRVATAPVVDGESSASAGETIARALAAPDLRAVFVLSDGISVNGSKLLRGVHAVLPPSVVVTGGLAADGDRFQRTWVLAEGRPAERTVTAVGFYGDAVRVGHGSRGGWDIFGPEREITRSSGNVLYELDGQPALDLYEMYLGERASGLPATALLFPLALRARSSDRKTLTRTVLSVDPSKRSMTFAGDVPQGSLAQLMHANFDRLIEGASAAGQSAATDVSGESLTVAISCVGRRLVLGERTEEEVEATSDAMPPRSKLVGYYSYGEISPFAEGECADLHNQTMTVTTLSEV
jgi:hypothetical protein